MERLVKPLTLVYDPTAPWFKLLVKHDSSALLILDGDGIEFSVYDKVWHLHDDDQNIFITLNGEATMLALDTPWEYKLI